MLGHGLFGDCTRCGARLPTAAARCGWCGGRAARRSLTAGQHCWSCDERLPAAAARCPHCGAGMMRGAARHRLAPTPAGLPDIRILPTDATRLERFATSRLKRGGDPAARFLIGELARARVCEPRSLPAGTVMVGTHLLFRHLGDTQARAATLAFPHDCQTLASPVSMATPLGVALIGLGEGSAMPYTALDGTPRRVVVERVLLQPVRPQPPAAADAAFAGGEAT